MVAGVCAAGDAYKLIWLYMLFEYQWIYRGISSFFLATNSWVSIIPLPCFFQRNSPPPSNKTIEACSRENLWNVSLQLFWGQVPSEISTYGYNSAIGACERAGKWETFGSAFLLGKLVGWPFLGRYYDVATTMVLHDLTLWKQRAIFRRKNCSTLKAWTCIWRGSWET